MAAAPQLSLEDLTVQLQYNVEITSRKYHFRTYKECFLGTDLVSWLVESNRASNRAQGRGIGKKLLEQRFIEHVTKAHTFKDNKNFYRVVPEFRIDALSRRMTSPASPDKHLQSRHSEPNLRRLPLEVNGRSRRESAITSPKSIPTIINDGDVIPRSQLANLYNLFDEDVSHNGQLPTMDESDESARTSTSDIAEQIATGRRTSEEVEYGTRNLPSDLNIVSPPLHLTSVSQSATPNFGLSLATPTAVTERQDGDDVFFGGRSPTSKIQDAYSLTPSRQHGFSWGDVNINGPPIEDEESVKVG